METDRSLEKALKAVGMLAPYACSAAIRGGVARCRKLVPCPDHPDDATPAPRPEVVLIKVNLNRRWDREFAKANVPILERNWERSQQLGEEHEARAKKLGRSAHHIRNTEGRDEGLPESADSGCPVFGPEGLRDGVQGKSISKIGFQLRDAGFRLVNAHRLMRNYKPPTRLVMVWERTEGRDVRFPWRLFGELTETCFKQVDVWANDRDKNGRVVHTVNCGKRDDNASPAYRLSFAGGDWEVVVPR